MQPTEPLSERVVLAGSERAPVLNAEDQGPVDPHQEAEITVYLKSKKSEAEVESYVDKLSEEPISERKYLSRQELAEWEGASSEDIAKVETFAAQYHLRVVKCDPGARTMFLRGNLGDLQQAFGVELRRYLAGGGRSAREVALFLFPSLSLRQSSAYSDWTHVQLRNRGDCFLSGFFTRDNSILFTTASSCSNR